MLEREGQVLLVMAEELGEILDDAVIDVVDDAHEGSKLTITQG